MLCLGAFVVINSCHQEDTGEWILFKFAQTHFNLAIVIHLKKLVTEVIGVRQVLKTFDMLRRRTNLSDDLTISRNNDALWEVFRRIRLNEWVISDCK